MACMRKPGKIEPDKTLAAIRQLERITVAATRAARELQVNLLASELARKAHSQLDPRMAFLQPNDVPSKRSWARARREVNRTTGRYKRARA